jgi:hypothetical protein
MLTTIIMPCALVTIDGFRMDDRIHWHHTNSTRNYKYYSAIVVLHTLQFTVTQSQSSFVVSRQWNYKSLTVIASYTKSSFHSLIPFLQSLLKHLRLPSLETPLFLLQSQSQVYFTTGGLPPSSSSWRQALETHDQYFLQLNACCYSSYVKSSLTRR